MLPHPMFKEHPIFQERGIFQLSIYCNVILEEKEVFAFSSTKHVEQVSELINNPSTENPSPVTAKINKQKML